MNNSKLLFATLIFTLMLCVEGCASGIEKNPSSQKYSQLPNPLLLGQLTKIYGKRWQGHGTFVWFELPAREESPSKRIDLWAFFGTKEDQSLAETASNKRLDESQESEILDNFHVTFLAEVERNHEENVNVVWPNKYTGKPVEEVYKEVYKWAEGLGQTK